MYVLLDVFKLLSVLVISAVLSCATFEKKLTDDAMPGGHYGWRMCRHSYATCQVLYGSKCCIPALRLVITVLVLIITVLILIIAVLTMVIAMWQVSCQRCCVLHLHRVLFSATSTHSVVVCYILLGLCLHNCPAVSTRSESVVLNVLHNVFKLVEVLY